FRTLAQKTKGELLPPITGYSAQDLTFSVESGSMSKRKSRATYASMSTLGTLPIMFLDRFYRNSAATKQLICAYSTFLKLGDDVAGTFSNIQTGLTADLRWKSLAFKNIWYGCNGTNSVQSYDGTTVNAAGVPTATVPTLAEGSATGITGTYRYKVSYVIDGYQEGTASSASDPITVSNKKVTVTIPVTSNTRGSARNIYRTTTGGSIYYFLATVSDNSSTTYTDSTADGSLDTTLTAPTDNAAPSAFKYMCLHKSRIFGARWTSYSSRIQYSNISSGISYPDIFPADNFFDVLQDNGEEITFIGEDNIGQLIIMKPSIIVKINTDTDDPVGWSGFTNGLSPNGCIAPYSAIKTSIGIIYLTRYAERKKRLMLWNGTLAQPIFEELEPILSGIVESKLTSITAHYQSGEYHLAYNDNSTGNDYNDKEIIIDLVSGSWTINKKNINCYSGWSSGSTGTTAADSGEMYTGSSDTTGLIRWEDVTSSDATLTESVIELIYVSQWIDFGFLNPSYKEARKQFYHVRIDFERTTATGTLDFGYYLDNSTTITEKSFNFSDYASKGYIVYQFPIGTFGKNIKYRLFHDDDTAALKITSVSFCFSVEPVMRGY
ncbi:MAG: hypothetical protein ABIH71_05720, partial [Candidatus Omnitrophota bacterium]